jgi:anion-transporting  ArsA/GET3 family ATPase
LRSAPTKTGAGEPRFLLVTGKGGVGKSTVALALARQASRRGRRVLLMQLHTQDRLGQLFGRPAVDTEIVELAPCLSAVSVTAKEAMQEYGTMILRSKLLYRAVFENQTVARFLKVIPGLPELLMLGKAYHHERELGPDGKHRWDLIIVDAPATGHGLYLLRIPIVITSALRVGHMVDEAKNMLALLRNPDRCRIELVTLPEEMPVSETIELATTLTDELELPLGRIFVNQVVASDLTEQERAAVVSAQRTAAGPERSVLGAALFRHERATAQHRQSEALEHRFGTRLRQFPRLPVEALMLADIDRLADLIDPPEQS